MVCRARTRRIGVPLFEVITRAGWIVDISRNGVGCTIQNIPDRGNARTSGAIGTTVRVQGNRDLGLFGPLSVDLQGVCAVSSSFSSPNAIEGAQARCNDARSAGEDRAGTAALIVLLQIPTAEGVTNLGGGCRNSDRARPLEVILRIVGSAIGRSCCLVEELNSIDALLRPDRNERNRCRYISKRSNLSSGCSALCPATEGVTRKGGGRCGKNRVSAVISNGIGSSGRHIGNLVLRTRWLRASRIGNNRIPQSIERNVGGHVHGALRS